MYLKISFFTLAVGLIVATGCAQVPSQSSSDIGILDKYAQTRNVEQLLKLEDPSDSPKAPWSVLRTGGCYGAGKYGWNALALNVPPSAHSENHQKFVVFTTRLTSEDIGELVFELTANGLKYVPEDDRLGARIVRHDFNIKINPAKKSAALTDACLINRDIAGVTMFRLSPCYRVISIHCEGTSMPFSQSGGTVAISMPAGTHKYDIAYVAVVDQPFYAGAITPTEALFSDDYWYPMIARWPAPYGLTMTVPKGWTVVGQGAFLGKVDGQKTSVWKYRMDLPVTIYSLSAGENYKTDGITVDGRNYRIWASGLSSKRLKDLAGMYPSIIEYYDKAFAPFPFTSYGAMITPLIGPDALEAYSFATYGDLSGPDSHEPSHTWWGGIIPNTYLHSLWNESFADFSMETYAQDKPLGNHVEQIDAFVTHPSVDGDDGITTIQDGGAFSGPIGSYLGYGKGSFVLAMLSDELGRTEMLKCMRAWIASHDPKTPGEWQDFEKVVEAVEGPHWKWFFDQWIRRSGYPTFLITGVHDSDGTLHFHTHFQGKPYQLKMEILLKSSGKNTYISAEIPSQTDSDIAIGLPEPPDMVSFDPWRKLLRKIDPNENVLNCQSYFASHSKIALGNVIGTIGTSKTDKVSQLDPNKLISDFNGKVLEVGNDALGNSDLKSLLGQIGMTISGTNLTWDGTTIDLTTEGAWAIIDLDKTHQMMVVLGNPLFKPETGDARLALFDKNGVFLRGKSLPKTSGNLVFDLK